ncbi:MAG: hypothetical protein ABR569_09980 [Gaiellaceae bacterium]
MSYAPWVFRAELQRGKERVMRRLLLLGVLAIAVLAFSSQAAANTTVQVSMTFTEPIVPAFKSGDCPVVPEGFCGSGEVIPLGHATETIDFGAGCGGTCDLRTIYLAGGSILIEETFSNFACPGVCGSRGLGQPTSGTLTDTIIGGTGIFEGATGSLTGTVRAAGLESQIKLSGTISFDP